MDSGLLAAKLFGAISAKIIIKIVSNKVPIQTYSSPNFFITKKVSKAEAEIFTRLLPIRITPKTLLISFLKLFIILADLLPCFSALSSFI